MLLLRLFLLNDLLDEGLEEGVLRARFHAFDFGSIIFNTNALTPFAQLIALIVLEDILRWAQT